MRWVLGLVPFAVAAGCGGLIAGSSDGGGDGPTTEPAHCASDSDCSNGYACLYPVSGGCSATKECFPPPKPCKGAFYCACDGTEVSVCGQGAPKPVQHAGQCAAPPPPPTCPPGPSCMACDVSGYNPTPQAKPIAKANVCPMADMAAFVVACLDGNATPTTCQTWQTSENTSDPNCLSCLFTLNTAAKWGPLVCDNVGCELNSGGCVDLELGEVSQEQGGGGAGSCGDLVNAEDGCVLFACGACTTSSDSTQCTNAMLQSGCKPYADAVANAPSCNAIDGGASVCFPQSQADFTTFLDLFCGQ